MHGWDHRRWQDGLQRFPRDRVRREFHAMRNAYRAALGTEAHSFGAPAWLATADLLEAEDDAGLLYASDVRGERPFRPVLGGRTFKTPQLPVTLPTLDEAASPERFADDTLAAARLQPGYCCLAAHAEAEGGRYRDVFERILHGIERPVAPLGETTFDALHPQEILLGRVAGRPYDVCVTAARK
jgi:peptidoglycan/xylan/chitin deacetylase (PgdA/CDA1 family)